MFRLLGYSIAFLCLLTVGHPTYAIPALELNGKGSYVVLSPKLTEGLLECTVEAWIRWDKFANWSRVFDFGKEGNAAVLQNEKKGNTLHFAIWDRNGSRQRVTAKNAIKKGQWHHVAVTTNGSEMAIYVDGERLGGDGIGFKERALGKIYVPDFTQVHGGTNYVGRSHWQDDDYFVGAIAEFRVWRVTRSDWQIAEAMGRQLSGNEDGLAGYWRFDGDAKDLSGNELHGVLMGTAISSQSGPSLDTEVLVVSDEQLLTRRKQEQLEAYQRQVNGIYQVVPLLKEGTSSEELYPNGRLMASGEVLARGETFIRTGRWTVYYPNGDRAAVGSLQSGIADGEWRVYHPRQSSALVAKGKFSQGVQHGEWIYYYLDPPGEMQSKGMMDYGYAVGTWLLFFQDLDQTHHITYSRVPVADHRSLYSSVVGLEVLKPNSNYSRSWQGFPWVVVMSLDGSRTHAEGRTRNESPVGTWFYYDESGRTAKKNFWGEGNASSVPDSAMVFSYETDGQMAAVEYVREGTVVRKRDLRKEAEQAELAARIRAQKLLEEEKARKRAAELAARKLQLETLEYTYHEKYDPTIVSKDVKVFGFVGHCFELTMRIHELAVEHPNKRRLRLRVVFDSQNKFGEEIKHDLGVYVVDDLPTVRRYKDAEKYVSNSGEFLAIGRFLNRAGYTKYD